MKSFEYTIKDKLGIHARPAGMLAKTAKAFESVVTIEKDGKSVNVQKLMMLMGLGIKHGDTIKITVEGTDEDTCAKAVEDFLSSNL